MQRFRGAGNCDRRVNRWCQLSTLSGHKRSIPAASRANSLSISALIDFHCRCYLPLESSERAPDQRPYGEHRDGEYFVGWIIEVREDRCNGGYREPDGRRVEADRQEAGPISSILGAEQHFRSVSHGVSAFHTLRT